MEHTVLVVEDEQGIREAIAIYLKNAGYGVVQASNGREGLQRLKERSRDIHLAVVDIMMPIMNGLEMVAAARKFTDIPVIFLSARSEDIDKINGLTVGADDYMTKPFGSMELLARVRSQLRRYEQILSLKESGSENQDGKLSIRDLELDPITKAVHVDGKLVHLTPKEFSILELFMRHPGQVFSAQHIYESIWNEEAINTDTIAVHIRKLREKIEANPKEPQYIQVVWGVGYKLKK